MDLCGPICIESVNGKKYILVIVDDYSLFTWVKFLRSKDEAPDFIIKFLKMIQVRLKVPVRRIRTDNGTEFVNQTLRDYYEEVGISHKTSVARSPQQNGVVQRCNRTLIEAARTMLIYAQASLFLWAESLNLRAYFDILSKSQDVLTVGSTIRIPLLYRGEYSQWVERFMNYLEEQTDREAMINSIKNGDQPLPRVTQVSIAGTTSTEQPPLKDKSMWSDQEKRVQKNDRLARSILI
nr:putative ribonuclease H-like domain-containing protein [Tanacetum cinerariifolium]